MEKMTSWIKFVRMHGARLLLLGVLLTACWFIAIKAFEGLFIYLFAISDSVSRTRIMVNRHPNVFRIILRPGLMPIAFDQRFQSLRA